MVYSNVLHGGIPNAGGYEILMNESIRKILSDSNVIVGRLNSSERIMKIHLELSSFNLSERFNILFGQPFIDTRKDKGNIIIMTYDPEDESWLKDILMDVSDDVWNEWLQPEFSTAEI